jgi:serine/threonine-protein kinase
LVCTHPKLGSRRLTVSIRSGRETREVVTLGKGKVKLLIRPWATVFLDGKKIGQTPFPPVEVEAGVHHLLLVNEDLHVRRERSVEVRPGRTLRVEETLK